MHLRTHSTKTNHATRHCRSNREQGDHQDCGFLRNSREGIMSVDAAASGWTSMWTCAGIWVARKFATRHPASSLSSAASRCSTSQLLLDTPTDSALSPLSLTIIATPTYSPSGFCAAPKMRQRRALDSPQGYMRECGGREHAVSNGLKPVCRVARQEDVEVD